MVDELSKRDGIDDLLDRAGRLHSPPTIALKIVEITRSPDFEFIDVVNCLEKDPALAASVLRLVNSSIVGLRFRVSSLRHAVTYLGRRALGLTAISFGIVKHMTSDAPEQLFQLYWKRSLTMACAARHCAQWIDADADEAFTAGLLADLGMLVLAQMHGNEYAELALASENSDRLVEAEQDHFGFDHADITARLLERWQCPDNLVQAAGNHHRLEHDASQLNQLLHVANLFAEALWMPHSPHMHSLKQILADEFDCDVDELIDLAIACRQDVNESAQVFQVQLTGEIDVDAVQREARRQFESIALEATLELDSFEAVVEDHSVMRSAQEPRWIH